MSWQPESTRWQQGPDGRPGVEEGAGALARPVLLGLAAGLGVALAGPVLVGAVVLGTGGDAGSGTVLALATALGVPLLALATALGAGLTGRRAGALRLPAGLARRAALGTGAGVGAVALALGIAPGLRWVTLPLYLAGVLAGTALGTRRAAPRR